MREQMADRRARRACRGVEVDDAPSIALRGSGDERFGHRCERDAVPGVTVLPSRAA
jgi:hypothetical protein